MEKFVCVRMIQANAMDLTLFQFDYDLTFAAFFMNADRTIYGRFGTRSSHDDPTQDISMDGFREALEGALELHAGYPANKASFAAKKGPAPRFPVPEKYPKLGQYKPMIDFTGKLAQSCLHCHQIRDAERLLFRSENQRFPDDVLYPYPMPETIGLTFDSKTRGTITRVASGSFASEAGLQSGDELIRLNDQPVLSIADVQWVLHNAKSNDALRAVIRRGNQEEARIIRLQPGWRERSDIAWRVTTWDLRRIATGGIWLEELSPEARNELNLPSQNLALRARHVGEYGEHAVAKNAGFKKGDIIVEFDRKNRYMRETDLLAYVLKEKKRGDQLPVTVLRGTERLNLELPIQ